MASTKHQHFIPRSYLKNFSQEENEKFFVEAKHKNDDKPKDKLLSIKDICVDKNIYTIPLVDGHEKYSLEAFYATEIDAVYPAVYRMLVNPEIKDITLEQRSQILATTMSLFFRTPKFYNADVRLINKIIDYASLNCIDENGIVKFNFREYNLDFHISDIEQVRIDLKIEKKFSFLRNHLKQLHDFIKFKFGAGICVYKVPDGVKLITSDNPVTMYSVEKNKFDVFDPTNIIRLPLDPNHFLVIMPNFSGQTANQIFRYERDERFAFTTNLDVESNSDEWIIGQPSSVANYALDKVRYTKHSYENIQYNFELSQKVKHLEDLHDVIHKTGGFANKLVFDKVNELRKNQLFSKDADLQKLVTALSENGFVFD